MRKGRDANPGPFPFVGVRLNGESFYAFLGGVSIPPVFV